MERATVSAAGGAIDVPSAFFTVVVDGSAPSAPQPANRASVGADLPLMEDISNGALADADVLAAPQPVAIDTPQSGPSSRRFLPRTVGLRSPFGHVTIHVDAANGTVVTDQVAEQHSAESGPGADLEHTLPARNLE